MLLVLICRLFMKEIKQPLKPGFKTILCLYSATHEHRSSYFDVMHHLEVELVCRALQDEGGAHVGSGVVEVEDDVVSVWATLGPKDLINFFGSLNFIWQPVSTGCAVERYTMIMAKISKQYSLHRRLTYREAGGLEV